MGNLFLYPEMLILRKAKKPVGDGENDLPVPLMQNLFLIFNSTEGCLSRC